MPGCQKISCLRHLRPHSPYLGDTDSTISPLEALTISFALDLNLSIGRCTLNSYSKCSTPYHTDSASKSLMQKLQPSSLDHEWDSSAHASSLMQKLQPSSLDHEWDSSAHAS